jgi:hypothetical protein
MPTAVSLGRADCVLDAFAVVLTTACAVVVFASLLK